MRILPTIKHLFFLKENQVDHDFSRIKKRTILLVDDISHLIQEVPKEKSIIHKNRAIMMIGTID